MIGSVEHPLRAAKEIAKSYEQTYSPLFHGQFGKFFHGVEQHPLGPLLDAATLLTFGAGGVAQAGELLGKAGLLGDESALAALRTPLAAGDKASLLRPGALTAPDFANVAGQGGEHILIKQASRNPAIRARQLVTNAGLNKLPSRTPVFGSEARVLKALSRGPERAAYALGIDAQPQHLAFNKLTPAERVVHNLALQGVHPADYKAFLEKQGNASPEMLKLLDSPKLPELAANPTPHLVDAMNKSRALSERMTNMKVTLGHISEQAAAESPYRLLRVMSGAKGVAASEGKASPALRAAQAELDRINNLHEKTLTREAKWGADTGFGHMSPSGIRTPELAMGASNPYRNRIVTLGHALERAQAKVDRLAKPQQVGLVGGKPIEQIAQELHDAGLEQPVYIPHTAETEGTGGKFVRKPAGFSEPGLSGASKQNLGTLASQGKLALRHNTLGAEFLNLRNHTEASLLHEEIVKHAAQLDHGAPLPGGYDFLKLFRGERAAPYTERIGGRFEKGLNPGVADAMLTKLHDAEDIATHPDTGKRLVVPSTVRKTLENKALTYHGALNRLLYSGPTSVWKNLVLGLRPAFFGNITVGNSILGALQMAPGRHGVAGWLNQVVPGADKMLGSKLTQATVEKVMPEQAAGTFGHQMGFGGITGDTKFASRTGITGTKLSRGLERASQGVMPATIQVENKLRLAMAEGWAKATPEVRAAMKANGGDVNAALKTVARTHPQVINDISRRVDDALGNYRTYSHIEQGIKQVVPFYGWDRHIARSTGRILSERPVAMNALTKVGALGAAQQTQALGELPSYMQGDIKAPGILAKLLGSVQGRADLLQTRSLDPFTSLAGIASIPSHLLGQAGGAGASDIASSTNPIIQALIEQVTGKSLLSGAPVHGNAFANEALNIPQVSALLAALGHGTPTTPTSLYQNDAATKLSALLGPALKKVSLQTAHLRAAQEHPTPKKLKKAAGYY